MNTEKKVIKNIMKKLQLCREHLYRYVLKDEKVVGFGTGGSESLVLFIISPRYKKVIARKIWSERILSAQWGKKTSIVMMHPLKKGVKQIEFIRNLPRPVRPYFTQIYDLRFENFYGFDFKKRDCIKDVISDQSFIEGLDVTAFIKKYQPQPLMVAKLYVEIMKCLKHKVHKFRKRERTKPSIETHYLDKINDRLTLCRRTAPRTFGLLMTSDSLLINGRRYINIPPLLQCFKHCTYLSKLEPKYHNLVVGDTNTENIILTNLTPLIKSMRDKNLNFSYEQIGIRFLDPRAIGFESVGKDAVDDPMYDSKMLHNSLGNYDLIHGEYFHLSVKKSEKSLSLNIKPLKDYPFEKPYFGIGQYLRFIMENGWGVNDEEYLKDDPYWLVRFIFLMGTHFAAMPPFHLKKDFKTEVIIDDFDTQKRAVAIYCEGVKWLNWAYQMLNGRISSFCGVFAAQEFLLKSTSNSSLNNNKRAGERNWLGPFDYTQGKPI